jgi:tricorn protease
MKIYEIALKKAQRSPFEPPDELHPETPEPPKDPAKPAGSPTSTPPPVIDIDLDGIAGRISEVPVAPGNYRSLAVAGKRLCWLDVDRGEPEKTTLQCKDIDNKGEKPETLSEGVSRFEFSGDGKKMLVQKRNDLFVYDAAIKEAALKTPKTVADAQVNLKDWTFSVIPADEFRELFLEAWRLHRDYFYDRNMHGTDWASVKEKYMTLTMRVRDRQELNDLIAQMVSELGALHTFVGGGDLRRSNDQIGLAALGAELDRDESSGGYVVRRIYQHDPDRPDLASPLARPGVNVSTGETIVAVDGRSALAASGIGELLRNRAGRQVALSVKPKDGTENRTLIVKPLSVGEDANLRYHAWEYSRRVAVEKEGGGQLGYVHLRAMGPNDIAQWAEQFYPIFNREGLIIDVRHNNGGNIDSWLLSKLLRKAWFYWQSRVGKPYWNMQYAFRGHIVVLCDERTASDGEAFAEGFRRLGLGKIIGKRTWGGEIWLSASNTLPDRGIATAAESGVFADGKWLIEGHGVDPDIVVDNLPHATFQGKDAQLDAAVAYLKKLIREKPITTPHAPAYPRVNEVPALSGATP